MENMYKLIYKKIDKKIHKAFIYFQKDIKRMNELEIPYLNFRGLNGLPNSSPSGSPNCARLLISLRGLRVLSKKSNTHTRTRDLRPGSWFIYEYST